jgi:hypothetical protein
MRTSFARASWGVGILVGAACSSHGGDGAGSNAQAVSAGADTTCAALFDPGVTDVQGATDCSQDSTAFWCGASSNDDVSPDEADDEPATDSSGNACPTGIEPSTCNGDGFCADGEDPDSCPSDCGESDGCGDGVCESDETADSCPADCGPESPSAWCGDNVCSTGEGESVDDCPQDCTDGQDAGTYPPQSEDGGDNGAAAGEDDGGTVPGDNGGGGDDGGNGSPSGADDAGDDGGDDGASPNIRYETHGRPSRLHRLDQPSLPSGQRGIVIKETAVDRTDKFSLGAKFLGVGADLKASLEVSNKTQVIFELASNGAQAIYADQGSLTVYSTTLFRAWRSMVFTSKTSVGAQMTIGLLAASAEGGVDSSSTLTTISEVAYGGLVDGFPKQYPAWEVMGYKQAADAQGLLFDARKVLDRMAAFLNTDDRTKELRALHETNLSLARYAFVENTPDFGCRYLPNASGAQTWACDFAKCPTFYLDLVDRGAGQFGPDVFPISIRYNYFQAKVSRLDVFGNAGVRNGAIQISHDACAPEIDEIDMTTVSADALRPRYFGSIPKEGNRNPAKVLRRRGAKNENPTQVNESATTDELIKAYPNYGPGNGGGNGGTDPW